MMRTIRRTVAADRDLVAIWLFIAQENPRAADPQLDAIEARWQQLLVHPFSGMARDDIAAGIRHLVAGNYLILYRVLPAFVEIVRILHGKRKVTRRDL